MVPLLKVTLKVSGIIIIIIEQNPQLQCYAQPIRQDFPDSLA